MKKYIIGLLAVFVLVGVVVFYTVDIRIAYQPGEMEILQPERSSRFMQLMLHEGGDSPAVLGYDYWGEMIHPDKTIRILNGKDTIDAHKLNPASGAIQIDADLLALGRRTFYEETFHNEVFLTDIVGIMDGALTLPNIARAIFKLGGEGTTNLQVPLAKSIKIGDRYFQKGELVDTGIDVAQGSFLPVGMPITLSEGRVRVGISCAACHAAVDPNSKKVVEGAPNLDLDSGLMLALAKNSTAFFTNTDIKHLEQYLTDLSPSITNSKGDKVKLPDPDKIDQAVKEALLKWPKGSFDSTIDLENNPAQIPDSFTLGDHPYGWNGFASIGPFKGLSVLNNNVHAQNSDTLAQADQSDVLFEIDKEVFIATILQNASDPKYRYDPSSGEQPSDFFNRINPTPQAPGVNEMITPPTYPYISLFTPNGTLISSPGYRVGEQINAMSAYQNSLEPAPPPIDVDFEKLRTGREIFERAGCISCHAGEAFTNNRVIPLQEIKTEPSRAKAFKDTVKLLKDPVTYSPDTPVPIPNNAKQLEVPLTIDQEQLDLVLAQNKGEGGYKVKGLIGLYWSPPYLHDGGVAVGKDIYTDLGIPGTLAKGKQPDPYNSLLALIDRKLREKVIKANKASRQLEDAHVQGIGHEFWVDEENQFTAEEQDALIHYLLIQTSK